MRYVPETQSAQKQIKIKYLKIKLTGYVQKFRKKNLKHYQDTRVDKGKDTPCSGIEKFNTVRC